MHLLRHLSAIVFATAACVSSVRAQTVSPQPAPTIITSAPYTIGKPGYYQLGANLTVANTTGNIITITSGNVTLDFAGHYISGPSNSTATQLYGVYAYERGNINILNGTVAYCYVGIEIDGNGQTNSLNVNQRIDNMLVSYCYFAGIFFDEARNSAISNCRVSSIGGTTFDTGAYGIKGDGIGINVVGNTVTTVAATTGSAYGIDEGNYVANNTVSGITAASGTGYGLINVTFAVGNTIDTATYGIHSSPSIPCKYKDNLTNNCTTPFYGGTAVGNANN